MTSKIRKLIYGMFDDMIEGADKYVTKSSIWLIFTEEKRWVLEFTKEKILWFNYNIFQSELVLVGMDCVVSRDVIKEWFESRFLEKDIAHVTDTSNVPYSIVENVVRNGVKDTKKWCDDCGPRVEDTIKNGVKHTESYPGLLFIEVDDIVQNGVKNTQSFGGESLKLVDKIIDDGVKHTEWAADLSESIEDVIQKGVKTIMSGSEWYHQDEVEDITQNGVKS